LANSGTGGRAITADTQRRQVSNLGDFGVSAVKVFGAAVS
jgi:hypothetical protein